MCKKDLTDMKLHEIKIVKDKGCFIKILRVVGGWKYITTTMDSKNSTSVFVPEFQYMKLADIKLNPNNPRYIKDEKFEKLKKSIEEFPKMMTLRPLVVNNDNIVLGGNMRLKALTELGYKEIPDEWVKNANELTTEEQRRFIIADNIGFGEHDWEMLQTEWDVNELAEWGLDMPIEWEDDENEVTEGYNKKIEAPIYEPQNKKPDIKTLYDTGKYKELINRIEKSNAPNDIKDFLKIAASRHIVFNYANIADFYSHTDENIQDLMEQSALIIIDFNQAIQEGYTKLSEEVIQQYQDEHGSQEERNNYGD